MNKHCWTDPSVRSVHKTNICHIRPVCFQALRVEKSLQLPKQHSNLQPPTWKSYLTSIFLTIVTTLAWKYLFQNRLRFWRENDLASQTAREKLHQETAKFAPDCPIFMPSISLHYCSFLWHFNFRQRAKVIRCLRPRKPSFYDKQSEHRTIFEFSAQVICMPKHSS